MPHNDPHHSASSSLTCEVCGARVASLRRGRCWICYIRWAESRPVGLGASCVVCGERRRHNLRLVEFQGAWVPMCHNCGTRALRLSPMPRSLVGLRQQLARDRRWAERRGGRADIRPLPRERRVGERRRALAATPGDQWLDAEDLVIEVCPSDAGAAASSGDDAPLSRHEPTCIAPLSDD